MFGLALPLCCFFVSLARGARVSTEEAQEFDWRTLAVIGALGAHTLAANGVKGLPERSKEQLSRDDDPPGLETRLVKSLQGHLEDLDDDRVVQDFVANLLRSPRVDKHFLEDFEANVRDRGLSPFSGPTEETFWKWLWRNDLETDVQHFGVHHDDGSRGVVLKRYHATEGRGPADVLALENILRSLTRADDHVLQVFARSHASTDVSRNPDADVLVLFEPFSSSLRDYLQAHEVSLAKVLTMFYSLMSSVNELHRRRIPHNAIFMPDNVLIVGDVSNIADTSAVLCPSILNTELRVCSRQEHLWSWVTGEELPEGTVDWDELMKEDVRQLGSLLAWMTAKAKAQEDCREILLLAENMKYGSIDRLGGFAGAMMLFEYMLVQHITFPAYLQAFLDEPHENRGTLFESDSWENLCIRSSRRYSECARLASWAKKTILRASRKSELAHKLIDDYNRKHMASTVQDLVDAEKAAKENRDAEDADDPAASPLGGAALGPDTD